MTQETQRTLWAMVFIALFFSLCVIFGWTK
jgi:hypothetical protein